MKDNEIIKALECCASNGYPEDCAECPYIGCTFQKGCVVKLMDDTLDLINRLQAENEKWQSLVLKKEELQQLLAAEKQGYLDELQYANAEIERLQKQCEMNQITLACETGMPKTLASIKKMYATAKSEARKEFADLITDKANVVQIDAFDYAYQITEDQIDNLLKELDGKEKENA